MRYVMKLELKDFDSKKYRKGRLFDFQPNEYFKSIYQARRPLLSASSPGSVGDDFPACARSTISWSTSCSRISKSERAEKQARLLPFACALRASSSQVGVGSSQGTGPSNLIRDVWQLRGVIVPISIWVKTHVCRFMMIVYRFRSMIGISGDAADPP